jgi:hypothetical protein
MTRPVIPCDLNETLRNQIVQFAEDLKANAHLIGSHGLDSADVHASGLFRGAIEKLRGEFSAAMKEKRTFIAAILDHMQGRGAIKSWEVAGASNRYDYGVRMPGGRFVAIEAKGCLDGNNTNIFERPANADEFLIWSVCQNPGASPRHNAWSGIHTRLSAEIVSRQQIVDGVVIWDALCGTIDRPCPKLALDSNRRTKCGGEGGYQPPPPCIYLFPRTIPEPRGNPKPHPHELEEVHFLHALHMEFGGISDELNYVTIEVAYQGADLQRTTRVVRGGKEVAVSKPTSIKRR